MPPYAAGYNAGRLGLSAAMAHLLHPLLHDTQNDGMRPFAVRALFWTTKRTLHTSMDLLNALVQLNEPKRRGKAA